MQAAEQAGNNELVRFIQSDDDEEEKKVQASYNGSSPIVEIEDNAELNNLIANSNRSKYDVTVKYGSDTYPIWLNVGESKYDSLNHIYSITNKKEDAPTNNGVGGPVGNHLQNASSDTIISQESKKSTHDLKKYKRKCRTYTR